MPPAFTLSAPVGAGQSNRPDDIALIRRLLNNFISLNLLPGLTTFAESGTWDNAMTMALKTIENNSFFGSANPNNKLENNDTLLSFLCNADLTQEQIVSTPSNESCQLATVMVPGGADWTKRTVIKTTEIVTGKPKAKKQI